MVEKLQLTIMESISLIPLPTQHRLLERFISLVDEECSMADLAAVVASDPALAAHILTLAASTSSHGDGAVSMEQLLTLLGRPLLRTVAVSLAVRNSGSHTFYSRNFDLGGFSCHSLLVAFLARALAREICYPREEEAYLAGLLHDIGQLLVLGGVAEYSPLLAAGKEPHGAATGVARIVDRMDPAEVGASLVESWRLDSFMADSLLFHRFPAEQMHGAAPLCRIVWVAHRLVTSVEGGYGESSPISTLLGLDAETVAGLHRSAAECLAERTQLLGLTANDTRKSNHSGSFISTEISLPAEDTAPPHDYLLWNMAAITPLQESLLSAPEEGELRSSLGVAASILYGLPRPVILRRHPDRPVLVAADTPGLPPLLKRLEIPLDSSLSLAAESIETYTSAASVDAGAPPQPRPADLQLARQLGTRGLLCIPMGSAVRAEGVMVFGLSRKQYAAKRHLLKPLCDFARLGERCLGNLRALRLREEHQAAELTGRFDERMRRVIHEAANPLGIMSNYLQILAERVGEAPEVRQELAILKEEIFRVEGIIRRLGDQPERRHAGESVNVNALIDGMLALYGESLFDSRKIRVDKELDAAAPLLVHGERDSLKQILLNLWRNSSAAMGEGGIMRIATRLLAQGNGNHEVEILLGDNGPGIPTEVMEGLFQPIQSECRSAASGVGLSIVASLVERLGGKIYCQSSPGEGTRFTIRLALGQKDAP